MRALLPLLAIFFLVGGRSLHAEDGPLKVTVPTTWNLKYDNSKGLDFYTVTPGEARGMGLLMFSKWPPKSKPAEIPKIVQQMADSLVTTLSSQPGVTVDIDYAIQPLTGEECNGSCAVFKMKQGDLELTQALFMVSVDNVIWNGQFTGKPADWGTVVAILQSLRRP